MGVYFVYRCGYLRPTNLLVRRRDDASIVGWFRRHWPSGQESAPRFWHDHVVRALGVEKGEDAIAYVCMFDHLAEEDTPPPETLAEVIAALPHYTRLTIEEHCIQMLTDDDELDMAAYFFDDEFLSQHSDLAAYPIHLLRYASRWDMLSTGNEERWQ